MCGIAGWFGTDAEKRVKTALKRMEHRGRDASGYVPVRGGVAGHNLHATVGHVPQPLTDGKAWMVGNLEIYNWKQLAKKHKLTNARNDAELVFKLLMNTERPETVFEMLDGPYALAFHNGTHTFLARDDLGVFPLFFSEKPLAFASERKAFPNLRELHPSKFLKYTNSKLEHHNKLQTPPETKGTIDTLIHHAIMKRVAGYEGDIALLLSGGVDSAIIAHHLKESEVPFTAVAVGLEGSSDLARAKKFAETIGIKLNAFELSKEEVLEKIPLISKAIESSDPVKVEAAAVVYFASKKADKKVVLAGFGADELFGGYARMHRTPHLEQKWALQNIYERSTYFVNVAGLLAGSEVRVPYLDKFLVNHVVASKDVSLDKKQTLRKIAEKKFGDLAWEPKKAAQYGSGFSKVLPKPKSPFLKQFHPTNKKLGALISGGKDSWSSILTMARLNYPIACLICISPLREDSWMFQLPDVELIKQQAKASGIPLILRESSGKKEEELKDLELAIAEAQLNFGIEGVISGALSSEYQRTRIESICLSLGLSSHAPLWGINHENYLRSAAKNLEFVIVSTAADGLDDEWVGRKITPEVAEDLITLSKKHHFSPAGEGGEFETFVENAPLFKGRINYKSAE